MFRIDCREDQPYKQAFKCMRGVRRDKRQRAKRAGGGDQDGGGIIMVSNNMLEEIPIRALPNPQPRDDRSRETIFSPPSRDPASPGIQMESIC